jgi:hypothetical protein
VRILVQDVALFPLMELEGYSKITFVFSRNASTIEDLEPSSRMGGAASRGLGVLQYSTNLLGVQ